MEQGCSSPILTSEELLQHLFKIDSLIELILNNDLAILPMSKLYNCLLTIQDLTSKAIEINEKLI